MTKKQTNKRNHAAFDEVPAVSEISFLSPSHFDFQSRQMVHARDKFLIIIFIKSRGEQEGIYIPLNSKAHFPNVCFFQVISWDRGLKRQRGVGSRLITNGIEW